MNDVHRIDDEDGARELARHLNRGDRTRPVIVLTTPPRSAEPLIDATSLVTEVLGLAEVYVLSTGPASWCFAANMPDDTEVYGGAGRAYPVGVSWVTDPRRTPLRLAYSSEEAGRAAEALAADALGMANAAGLLQPTTRVRRRRVTGEVRRVLVGGQRAVVEIDRLLAVVAQPLTVPDVSLERVLSAGMSVQGVLDESSKVLDVRDSLLPVEEALASYRVGAVVLARVGDVREARAVLDLHPDLSVEIDRPRVTGNELDDLRTLLTPGEVVTARVTTTSPWSLAMLDVDDDEEVLAAAPLLPGGPPWLDPSPVSLTDLLDGEPDSDSESEPREPKPVAPDVVGPPTTDPVSRPRGPRPAPPPGRRAATGAGPALEPTPAPPRPPLEVLREELSQAREALETLRASQERLSSELQHRADEDELRRAGQVAEVNRLSHQIQAQAEERNDLVAARSALHTQVSALQIELRGLRSELRKARQRQRPLKEPTAAPDIDPELAFRQSVLTAWASRTPAAERAVRPLPGYRLGPQFLASLAQLHGISTAKVAGVAFEVVTGRAAEVVGRELHPLRSGSGGNDPQVTREDGARCWRAALQRGTPSARRLHYWVLSTGEVELSRVVLHDDVRP